jgi:small subunit ribosomal protein S13
MPRIKGIDIPAEKRIEVSLTYIYGVGPSLSKKILDTAKVNYDTRAKNITDEGEMRRIESQNIRRLKEIKSYRGLRHHLGLPTRGQNTRTNSRTRKGKRKTVGGQKKKLAKK